MSVANNLSARREGQQKLKEMVEIDVDVSGKVSHQDPLHDALGQGDAKRQATERDLLSPLSFTIEVQNRLLRFASREL